MIKIYHDKITDRYFTKDALLKTFGNYFTDVKLKEKYLSLKCDIISIEVIEDADITIHHTIEEEQE